MVKSTLRLKPFRCVGNLRSGKATSTWQGNWKMMLHMRTHSCLLGGFESCPINNLVQRVQHAVLANMHHHPKPTPHLVTEEKCCAANLEHNTSGDMNSTSSQVTQVPRAHADHDLEPINQSISWFIVRTKYSTVQTKQKHPSRQTTSTKTAGTKLKTTCDPMQARN
eukprot:m.262034 g.262034  ORF g.262034 m.262034 type:complete len:166 (-) comp15586_c0_seq2:3371-3868(-)